MKRSNPESLDNVDINFDNLLCISQPNPKDYFYMKVFGKTFEQKQKDDEFDVSGYSDEDKNAKTLEEKVEAMV